MSAASVEAYIRSVGAIPVLDAQQEYSLAEKVHARRDASAAKALILSNLRFVVHISAGYLGYGLPFGDLIQEGNIGLIKAVDRFDPAVGVRLISYAVYSIRAQIHEFILANWRIVKLGTTKAQRKLFFNLRKYPRRLAWLNRQEVEAVATDLQVHPSEVREMEAMMSGRDAGIVWSGQASAGCVMADSLGSLEDPMNELLEAESNEYSSLIARRGLAMLDARSRDIIARRFPAQGAPAGLEQLAQEYGVSAERIRQIQVAALRKLREFMEGPLESVAA